MRTAKEIIKHMTTRANALAAMSKPNEDIYWQLKQELFRAETVWERETPRYYWPKQMKIDIFNLNEVLDEVWRKICA